MFIFFLSLTILFAIVLIAGFVWMLVTGGKTIKRSGPEVGAEIMSESTADDLPQEGEITVAEKTWFRGTGVAVKREAEYSYGDIKQQFRQGGLRAVLPVVMTMSGLVGLTLFLGLTLLVGLSDKLFGVFLLAFSAYCAYLILRGFLKRS